MGKLFLTDTTRKPRPGEEDGKGTVALSDLTSGVCVVIITKDNTGIVYSQLLSYVVHKHTFSC